MRCLQFATSCATPIPPAFAIRLGGPCSHTGLANRLLQASRRSEETIIQRILIRRGITRDMAGLLLNDIRMQSLICRKTRHPIQRRDRAFTMTDIDGLVDDLMTKGLI
ncbi:MAG: hypothetical protein CBARDCOR_3473 [uncultured Caballeronia sp.]|nr:MAG: hypothetical protein CBARDCOR_3473 [uncultured Caballeronia sp.]